MKILGLSAFYHDASACLIVNGEIMAAVQEERFTRKKNDAQFPAHSIRYCLKAAGLGLQDIDAVVFYDKPLLTFERLLETYLYESPRGLHSYLSAMPVWLHKKLNLKGHLRKCFKNEFGQASPKIYFSSHHLSHAASAFYPSPFSKAAVLCLDGVGEWATTSAWLGDGSTLKPLWEIQFPHSLGLLYSAMTGFCGFKVNSGEYKLMGLAPFGKPRFQSVIEEHLIDIKADGTFRLNMNYFSFTYGLKMFHPKVEELFNVKARPFEGPYDAVYADLAASIQQVTNKVILRLGKSLNAETGAEHLCLAGGVALNCVANGLLADQKIYKSIWVQPAAGDAGGSLGAALAFYHLHHKADRAAAQSDTMKAGFLGPEFLDSEIEKALGEFGLQCDRLDTAELLSRTAKALSEQKIIGWFQGRMEYGPRALGHRSILGDPRNPDMKSMMNLKIKFREGFRPFAPSVLKEYKAEYFETSVEDPYMLFTGKSLKPQMLPSITHEDQTARLQCVNKESHPMYHALIEEFRKQTGCPVLINTSMNVRGEPMVCSPIEAIQCFLHTDIDVLVMGSFIIDKSLNRHVQQPKVGRTFELD